MRAYVTVYFIAALSLCVVPAIASNRLTHLSQNPAAGVDPSIAASKLHSVLGVQVRTKTEETIGRIIDLLADRDGNVLAAVIEFGGFLGIGMRRIAVDWSSLRIEATEKSSVATLEASRDELRLAPEYKSGQPLVIFKVEPTPPRAEPPRE